MTVNRSERKKVYLALEDISLRVGERRVFVDTQWQVRGPEQWAILGPNGSGKSLLARAVAGEIPVASGEVHYGWAEDENARAGGRGGEPEGEVALVSAATQRAVMARESSFYQSRWHTGAGEGKLTVSRFLSQDQVEEINPFELDARRGPRSVFLQRQREASDLLELKPLWRRKLIHLSNGEMRKVLLARALLRGPRLLVLDEPYLGLDVTTRARLRRAIRELMRQGLKILVLTSRPDEIPGRASHLLLVEGYRVVAQGRKRGLWSHPLVRRLAATAPAEVAGTPRPRVPIRGGKPPEAAVLIAMRKVNVRAGAKRILREVTWTVRRGENWALVGPNGSGKTTLLSLIQGDHPQVYAQDISLFGLRPDSTQALWQARQYLGWLSPELHLHYPPEWGCLEVVCSGLFDSIGLYQACTARQYERARRWLKQLGLGTSERKALGQLSLGDQRMVLLGRAMVKTPRLCILDEPCQGLDRAHRQLLLAVVDRVVGSTGAGLIFVTHHRDEVPQCITHRLRLQAGRVVEQARMGE
jgi:molybdate transport system ATP-binding protein